MARFLLHGFPDSSRKWIESILALSWVLGLISGCALSLSADTSNSFLMPAAPWRPVSITSLSAVLLLPFLFSWFAVSIQQTWLFIPIAYTKALVFAAISTAISLSFGSAGWLMSFLMLFSSICTMPVLLFFWLRYTPGHGTVALRDVVLVIIAVFLLSGFDFYFISPLLAGL